MIPSGYSWNLTSEPWTCRSCGKPVFQSLYCSWRCARRGQAKYLAMGLGLWVAAATLIYLFWMN